MPLSFVELTVEAENRLGIAFHRELALDVLGRTAAKRFTQATVTEQPEAGNGEIRGNSRWNSESAAAILQDFPDARPTTGTPSHIASSRTMGKPS
jgi:hypothetical protein